MTIRTAQMEDIDAITAVETECFPPAEAATREEFAERLKYYKDHFWLMFDEGHLVAFVDGMVSNQKDLTDEMYVKAEYHSCISKMRSGRAAIKKSYCRCKSPGKKRAGADLQG